MNNPRFSIVIPTYQRQDSLNSCLRALQQQLPDDDSSFEIIIVQDGEGSFLPEAMLKGFGSRVACFTIPHQGAAAARNYGIRQARGEIVLFLDDDAIIADGWVDRVAHLWREFPESEGIGGCVIKDQGDTLCSKVNADLFNWYLRQGRDGDYADFISTCNAGYRRESLSRSGGFDEAFRGAYGEDRDISIRLRQRGGKLRLEEDLLIYHDQGLGFSGFLRRHFNYGRGAYKIYRKHPELKRLSGKSYLEFYRSIIDNYEDWKEKILAFFLLTLSQIATACGYLATWLSHQ